MAAENPSTRPPPENIAQARRLRSEAAELRKGLGAVVDLLNEQRATARQAMRLAHDALDAGRERERAGRNEPPER